MAAGEAGLSEGQPGAEAAPCPTSAVFRLGGAALPPWSTVAHVTCSKEPPGPLREGLEREPKPTHCLSCWQLMTHVWFVLHPPHGASPRSNPTEAGLVAGVGFVVPALHTVPSSRKPGWMGCTTPGPRRRGS